jgi:hypothetical protein
MHSEKTGRRLQNRTGTCNCWGMNDTDEQRVSSLGRSRRSRTQSNYRQSGKKSYLVGAAAFLDVLASVRGVGAAVSPAMCYDAFIQACSRNMPNGMMASIHHHEAGTPSVCLVITKRTERTRTQRGVNKVSSQRLFHLVITHLSMPYSLQAASLPFSTRRISRRHWHFFLKDR